MVIFNNIFSTHNLSFVEDFLQSQINFFFRFTKKKYPASILEVALAIFYWRASKKDTPLYGGK